MLFFVIVHFVKQLSCLYENVKEQVDLATVSQIYIIVSLDQRRVFTCTEKSSGRICGIMQNLQKETSPKCCGSIKTYNINRFFRKDAGI